MTTDLEKGLDQCPACNGTGKHTLKAPNGVNFVEIVITSSDELYVNGVKRSCPHNRTVNQHATALVSDLLSEGYTLHSSETNKNYLSNRCYRLVWKYL